MQDAHGVRAPEGAADAGAAIRTALNWNKVYAWHLTAAAPYESPLPYVHPSGAITWVDLPAAVAAATSTALDPPAPTDASAATPEGHDVDSDSSGPPRPRAAARRLKKPRF